MASLQEEQKIPPNMSVPPEEANMSVQPPPAPVAENRYPGMPFTDPETHQTGTVPMDQVREVADKKDAELARAADWKLKEEKIRQINLSPLSAEERQKQIHELIGPSPEMQAKIDSTPIDIGSNEGLQDLAVNQNQTFTENNARIAHNSGDVVRAEGALAEKDIANRAPLDEQRAQFLQGQYHGLEQLEAMQAEKTQEQIGRYQQTNEDMRQMAIEKPKDLFGEAGVNGVLGRIAIFLGGAGTNGEHENHNLAYIQDMANRNIKRQERNWNHMQAVGENDKSVYGMIRNQTKDAEATTAIMNNMYLSSYEANLKSMANKYPHERTQLAVNKALVAIDQQRNANDQIGTQALINTGTKLLQVSGAQAVANAKLTLAANKQKEREQQNGIPGYRGYAPQVLLAKISAFHGGGISIIDNLKRIQQVLADKKASPYDKERVIMQIRNDIKGAARKYYETGTRLEGPEIGQMETTATSMIETVLAELHGGGGSFTGLNEKINATRQQIAHSIATRVTAETKALTIDKEDKVWGGVDPEGAPDVGNAGDGTLSEYAQRTLDQMEGRMKRRDNVPMGKSETGTHWGEH